MDVTPQARFVVLDRRYVLERCVGAGASGRVYRAYDRLLARTVAVKVLAPGTEEDERRYRSEVTTQGRLSHPGLVRLLDAGVAPAGDGGPGRRYAVMEFVEGPSLARRLQGPPLEPAELERIAVSLAGTLDHLHDCGVVHRDLKPSNILLDPAGLPMLTDFGVARSPDASAGLTATGCVIGTPRYMAPEQVRGEPVTPASDVYALGLVLLECATGRPEYPGPAIESAVARLFRAPEVPDDLAEPLRSAIRAMTATDPADRPSAAEVHRALGGPATEQLPLLFGFRFEPAAARRAGRGMRRHPALLTAAAVTGVLVAGSLAAAAGDPGTAGSPAVAAAAGSSPTAGSSTARPGPPAPTAVPAVPVASVGTSTPSSTTSAADTTSGTRISGRGAAPAVAQATGHPGRGKGEGRGRGKGKGHGKGKGDD